MAGVNTHVLPSRPSAPTDRTGRAAEDPVGVIPDGEAGAFGRSYSVGVAYPGIRPWSVARSSPRLSIRIPTSTAPRNEATASVT